MYSVVLQHIVGALQSPVGLFDPCRPSGHVLSRYLCSYLRRRTMQVSVPKLCSPIHRAPLPRWSGQQRHPPSTPTLVDPVLQSALADVRISGRDACRARESLLLSVQLFYYEGSGQARVTSDDTTPLMAFASRRSTLLLQAPRRESDQQDRYTDGRWHPFHELE
jgi:hypothetical protein